MKHSLILLVALCLTSPAALLVRTAPIQSGLYYAVELPDDIDSARAYPLIVAIHGHGDRMSAHYGTAPRLCPEGAIGLYPESPFPFENAGSIGWTWWLWGDSASGLTHDVTKEQSIRWILACINEAKTGYPVDPSAIFLYGFSQGAILTYDIGVRYPSLFRGLIPVGGFMDVEFDSLEPFNAACLRLPVRALHGAYDDVVEFGADQASVDTLRNRGVRVELLRYPAGHQVTEEMDDDARDFVATLLHGDTLSVPADPAAAYAADTGLEARAALLYRLGSKRLVRAESLLTAVLKSRCEPSRLRQAAYSALVKLATETAWQTVKATPRVVAIDGVVSGSNGQKAGLKSGDVIVSYNGRSVKLAADLRAAIDAVKPGVEQVALVARRAGSRLTFMLPPGRIGIRVAERVK